MVKRRGRPWRVTGWTVTVACLAGATLAGCSLRTDVARPLDGEEGGSGAQLPNDKSGGSGGAAAGSNTGGRANGGGSAGKPSGGGGGQGAAAGEGGSAGEASASPTVSEIMDSYRTWEPQTPEPMPISSYIFGLCRLPTLAEQEFAESEHGRERYLQNWANAEAMAGIARRGAPPFAPGSVIVKEKYVPSGSELKLELVAVAMMIKREQGFAPAHGDWDYAYYEPELGMIQTQEQSDYCSGCHVAVSSTDFVFIDGLRKLD